MQQKEIASWKSWKDEIAQLQETERTRKAGDLYFFSELLFRGQTCASWELKSTLERRSSDLPSISEYGRIVKTTKVAFESLTDRRWETVFSNSEAPGPPEDYEFIVYLRHHGFPTPILDWTRSPYVASFFAFQTKSHEKTVSIFSYREYCGTGKETSSDESAIIGCGPTIRTHQRHYHQQSEYTFCRKKVERQWHYSSHEEAFSKKIEGQDVCVKYILPASISGGALADLDSMNINAYSLFSSEEGLSEMLANRQYGYNS
jgi:hypothetical protein